MDLRTERTLQWIENAFVQLVLTEGFAKVTVSQLSNDAQINRKTFYAHYLDKYDLATKLGQDFLAKYDDALQERLTDHTINLQAMIDSFMLKENEGRLLRALLLIHTEEFDFEQQFTALLKQRISQFWQTDDPLEMALLTNYALTTIRYYAGSDEHFSLERQVGIIRRLTDLI